MDAQKRNVSDFLPLIRSHISGETKNDPNIGDMIKAIREFVGLTQRELADEMQLSRKTISKYENDFLSFKRVVSLHKFAKALSVNNYIVKPDDFLIV